ncbi:MAG: MmcQ/YjbR family DNA-binding protein [Solirubrobacteraceae bacterium]
MDAAALRRRCLSLPGSTETFPFGPQTSVFKVGGKMFALSRLAGDPLQISLKCEPALADQLRDAHPAVRPGYHLNKRHWNTVRIDGSIADQLVEDMIEAGVVDLAVQEYAVRHADLIEKGIDHARSVLVSGDAAIAAHLLDVPLESVQRVSGGSRRSSASRA